MSAVLSLKLLLFISVLLIVPRPASASGGGALVDRTDFSSQQSYTGTGIQPISFLWKYGDRERPLDGVMLDGYGSELRFQIKPSSGKNLTLELREFRTERDQSPAYLIHVDNRPVAFRCRRFLSTGPISAFIDLSDRATAQTAEIRITNRNEKPICFSEAYLYENLESYVQQKGFSQPMHVGPTIRPNDSVERLKEIRAMLPECDEMKPMCLLAAAPVANLAPADLRKWLEDVISKCAEADLPLELQLVTWWAGTPGGLDGEGGSWHDPEYQQINYVPSEKQYFLAVPNRWSSTPWLTVRHPRLNAFKRMQFKRAGQLLREIKEQYQFEQKPFPVMSLVIDNEVTYWGAGMPETPVGILADVNPVMVAAAKAEGVQLNPEDGFSEEEIDFLRRSLRVYNREMAQGLVEGLGNSSLRDITYTHTWANGPVFDDPSEAYETGVLKEIRMGGEWNYTRAEQLAYTDLEREFGIPAAINVELGGQKTFCEEIPFAFAAGSRHASMFNADDELLKVTFDQIRERGWDDYPPVPWRKSLLEFDFTTDEWEQYITGDDVHVQAIGSKDGFLLHGKNLEQPNRCQMHLDAKTLTRDGVLPKLWLRYRARAFVFLQPSDEAYLIIRAGRTPENLKQVERLTNASGWYQLDLSEISEGSEHLYLEYEFHPLGLHGWVGLFDLAFEIPWEEESLLHCNRSYRADRLRAESRLAGWRADAVWTLQQCHELSNRIPADALGSLHDLMMRHEYRQVHEEGLALLHQARQETHQPCDLPSPNRTVRGQLRSAGGGSIRFSPYHEGYTYESVVVSETAETFLVLNGEQEKLDKLNALKAGDDLELEIQQGQVVRLMAHRAQATGVVVSASPATAFSLPKVQIEGGELLDIDSRCSITDRTGEVQGGSCPLVTDKRLFEPGDKVTMRWNPSRKRIVEIRPEN